MPNTPASSSARSAVPIVLVNASDWQAWIAKQKAHHIRWAKLQNFTAEAGTHCLLPDASGAVSCVVVGCKDVPSLWSLAALPDTLPYGQYRLETKVKSEVAEQLMLGWELGSYRFTRYKKAAKKLSALLPIPGADTAFVTAMSAAIGQARDLINTPANDMGPEELASACKKVASTYGAKYHEIVGENLVKQNYPAIYEVGKASSRAPRLIDIRWGNPRHPKVTLVGKGVCFDSGGLDIKPSSGMKLMKKDMGGAAAMLAVARLIMETKLKVCLRLLIPAVENSISGNAYRPFDIIQTRKGMSVEVGNTDAEGRLILGDALWEADSETPALLIDCATLTGAARTALGTDIPALFTPDDTLAADLARHSTAQHDPLWRLPLWQGYREMLNSPAADINSAPDSGYAGAITAALYLKECVPNTTAWAHLDMMAWNLTARPGRPAGGEAMAVRALYALIKERFSTGN
jgi:leucyl aminopeptidase